MSQRQGREGKREKRTVRKTDTLISPSLHMCFCFACDSEFYQEECPERDKKRDKRRQTIPFANKEKDRKRIKGSDEDDEDDLSAVLFLSSLKKKETLCGFTSSLVSHVRIMSPSVMNLCLQPILFFYAFNTKSLRS